MEKLNITLAKPLAFIKVQTTGLKPRTDRIIELSIIKVNPDGKIVTGSRYINPEMEIPEESTRVNGITTDMVKDAKKFGEVAQTLATFLDGCDFIGFNIKYFDLRFLSEEFNRAKVEFTIIGREIIDLSSIYHTMEPRDLNAAYQFYCGKKNEANNSEKTNHIYSEILNKMLEKYSGQEVYDKSKEKSYKIEPNISSLSEAFNKARKALDIEGNIVLNEAGVPIFNFGGKYGPSKDGKTPGRPVGEALYSDQQYYDWLINVSEMPADTKLMLTRILNKYKAKVSSAATAK
jgi:DNA polymerase-3 subunit epsilon